MEPATAEVESGRTAPGVRRGEIWIWRMKLLDVYDVRARLSVTYLVFSPVVVFVIAFSLGTADWWSRLGGLAAGCGAPLLGAQWGRSGGLRKERLLWESWGGPPTEALLRFSTGGAAGTVERRHESVSRA